MKYRGYYIDNAIFSGKADIDRFIKEQNIRSFKSWMQMFNRYSDKGQLKLALAASSKASEVADYLVKHCGMTWADIEALEAAA